MSRSSWKDFRAEYQAKVLAGAEVRTREEAEHALDQFERLVHPGRMQRLTSRTVADFVAARRRERGLRPGSTVSPATLNKELRHLKAALRKAQKWSYLPKVPEFEFLKEPKKLPSYVPPEHFVAIYDACDAAVLPEKFAFDAAEWWRTLLVTASMTGWRIGQLLAFKRDDVILETGEALTRTEDTKGKRVLLVVLHPVVVEHLCSLRGFGPTVFPWHHARKLLWGEFQRIQTMARVKAAGGKPAYGFHDLRRGFATMNADRLTPDALQRMMQHKDYQTTQRYIHLARQLRPAAENLFVPELGKGKKVGEG